MDWIRVDVNVLHNPKLRALKTVLGERFVFELVVGLWAFCAQFATDGDLSRFSDLDIAAGSGWDGDPSSFIEAMIDSGWIERDADGALYVHDWHEHQGKLIERRRRDRERMREYRAQKRDQGATVHERSTNVARTVRERSTNSSRTVAERACNVQGDIHTYERTNVTDEQEEGAAAPAAAPARVPDPVNLDPFFETWQTVAAEYGLPQLAKVTDARRRAVRARLKEHGPDAIDQVLTAPRRSAFLRGEKSSDRPFTASFDWLMKPSNFVKVFEGNYDDKKPRRPAQHVGEVLHQRHPWNADDVAVFGGGNGGEEHPEWGDYMDECLTLTPDQWPALRFEQWQKERSVQ